MALVPAGGAGGGLTLSGNRQDQITEIANWLDTNYGGGLGSEFETYAAGQTPSATAKQLYLGFVLTGVGGQLPKTIAEAEQAQGKLTAQAAAGTVAGLDATEKDLFGGVLGFLSNLASANLWLRIGEVVLGIVLIAVGTAELTHAVPIATKIASTVK